VVPILRTINIETNDDNNEWTSKPISNGISDDGVNSKMKKPYLVLEYGVCDL